MVREADDLDEAGRRAAGAFADRLHELSDRYAKWAERILKHLEAK